MKQGTDLCLYSMDHQVLGEIDMTEYTHKVSAPQRKLERTRSYYERYNGEIIDNTVRGSSASWIDQALGEKNPRWKAQVKAGVQAATGFTGQRTKVVRHPYYAAQGLTWKTDYRIPTYPVLAYKEGYYTTSIPSSPEWLSADLANSRALSMLVKKIRDKQTTFQGGVFFGELLQTITLLRNPATLVRRGLDEYGSSLKVLRKKFPKQLSKLTKKQCASAVADKWLEYQLGWAPLLSEVDDMAKAIGERILEPANVWQPVRAIGVDEKVTQDVQTVISASDPYIACRRISKEIVTVRYIALVDVGSYGTGNITRMGIAPTNWIPTLWELIPYSFVVDYFTNIGNIISAASLAKSSVRWIVKTERRTKSLEYYDQQVSTTLNNYYAKAYVMGTAPGKLKITKTNVSREPYYGSLVPDLVFSIPSVKQGFNIAALAKNFSDLKTYFR
jgi:hypothetical protein